MKAYVEFEIQEGAYDISCPDALCPNQGILTINNDISALITNELLEKHKRFRVNRGMSFATILHGSRMSKSFHFFPLQKLNWTKIERGVHVPVVKQFVWSIPMQMANEMQPMPLFQQNRDQ